MQKFLLNLAGLGLLTALLFLSSCTEDDPIVTNPLGPEIQFLADTDILSADADVIIGESFTVKIKLDKGDNPLNSVEIQEDGSKLATDRFTINGGAITTNNAFAITGADQDGVTYSITINPGAHAVDDFTIYKFIVTDTKPATASVDIAITTTALPGTPLSMSISGVLFNQAGPAGTGGLDLDAGTGVGSSDATAEIRDLGIDCALPNATNWRARIGTLNGANMLKVDASQLENFTFDNVDKIEPIIDAYNTGVALADGESQSCTGSPTAVTDVSDAVVAGDMFVILANDTYYLIRIDNVNATTDNNDDNYELSIKY